jgi:transcriptional regulator with XRE-family HTH domain
MDITPAQSRAARGLAGLTQDDLARLSRVSKRTIVQFETGAGRPIPATLAAIQRALEAAGVEFIPGGARLREQPAEAQAS